MSDLSTNLSFQADIYTLFCPTYLSFQTISRISPFSAVLLIYRFSLPGGHFPILRPDLHPFSLLLVRLLPALSLIRPAKGFPAPTFRALSAAPREAGGPTWMRRRFSYLSEAGGGKNAVGAKKI